MRNFTSVLDQSSTTLPGNTQGQRGISFNFHEHRQASDPEYRAVFAVPLDSDRTGKILIAVKSMDQVFS